MWGMGPSAQGLFCIWSTVFHSHRINSSSHSSKHLLNQFKIFCCLLTVGPQSKCGDDCYCVRAFKTAAFSWLICGKCLVFMWRVIKCSLFVFTQGFFTYLKMTKHTTSLLPHVYSPLRLSRHGVFGVVTARILPRSACIPFIPDPPGVRLTSPNHCPSVRESDRCRIRQMVGKFMVQWHPPQACCT